MIHIFKCRGGLYRIDDAKNPSLYADFKNREYAEEIVNQDSCIKSESSHENHVLDTMSANINVNIDLSPSQAMAIREDNELTSEDEAGNKCGEVEWRKYNSKTVTCKVLDAISDEDLVSFAECVCKVKGISVPDFADDLHSDKWHDDLRDNLRKRIKKLEDKRELKSSVK